MGQNPVWPCECLFWNHTRFILCFSGQRSAPTPESIERVGFFLPTPSPGVRAEVRRAGAHLGPVALRRAPGVVAGGEHAGAPRDGAAP